jgi:hypothetical protein
MKTFAFSLLLLCPLLMGTTYVVQENGIEVGQITEHDGRTEEHRIDAGNIAPSRGSQASPARPELQLKAAYENQVQKETRHWQLRKEQEQSWGLRPGMVRADVEKTAEERGIPLFLKYSDGTPPSEYAGDIQSFYWVLEYRYKTTHYDHVKKVYFGSGWRVEKIVDSFQPRQY